MTEIAVLKEQIQEGWEAHAAKVLQLSEEIHARPETAFQEFFASMQICKLLEANGFQVERAICSLPTAFVASIGSGSLCVGICAEYDALPTLGHACGHNLIAAAAVGAALALQQIVDQLDITLKVFGTPGEEWGDAGGKIVLLEHGAFTDVHMAMMVHPAPFDACDITYLAAARVTVRYTASAFHSSCGSGSGGSPVHALAVMQVALGLLASTLDPYSRINGVIEDGGKSPNVSPECTQAVYLVRSRTIRDLKRLQARVRACFEAAGLATGCGVQITGGDKPYAEMLQDPLLLSLYRANAERRGRSFGFGAGLRQSGGPSTDMGNVSHAVPSIHPCIGINSWPAANHESEFALHCIGFSAEKAVADGAWSMAATVVDVASDPALKQALLARAANKVSGRLERGGRD